MTVDYPAPGQIPQLRALWEKAFGDSGEFLDLFFERAYAPERCRCITLDGKVAAMLFWFETFCEDQRFAYVYAVSTDPDYRNRGLCRMLMDDVREILTREGYDGILLYPASPALSEMYARMGYRRCTAVREFTCGAGAPAALRPVSRGEYARLRRKMLPEGGVIQEGAMLDFLGELAEFYAGADWVAAVTPEEDHLHVQELLGSCEAAPGIVGALGKKDGIFRTPGSEKPFAMGCPLSDSCKMPVYFGLPLD